jgi:hypothetical protein
MPTEILAVLFIGFLNVCLGYAFAIYIWPGAPPAPNQRPFQVSTGSKRNVRQKTVRITRPSRFRSRSMGMASIETQDSPASTDSDSRKQLEGRGAAAVCRGADSRVVNKIDHLHKRLKRIGQQAKQLGEAPDGREARSLWERIDRVSRGGIEDLRYAVREASPAGELLEEAGVEIDTLAFRVRTIVDGLGSLDFDDVSLEDSVVQLRQASDKLVQAISMSRSNLQRPGH